MLNVKKLFSLTIMGIIVMCMSSTSVLANDALQVVDSPAPIMTYEQELDTEAEMLSEEEYAEVLREVRIAAEADVTPELKAKVIAIRKEIKDSENAQSRATYDSLHLETILSVNDGVNILKVLEIGTIAKWASNEAISLYQDTTAEMKRDAYRHQ